MSTWQNARERFFVRGQFLATNVFVVRSPSSECKSIIWSKPRESRMWHLSQNVPSSVASCHILTEGAGKVVHEGKGHTGDIAPAVT